MTTQDQAPMGANRIGMPRPIAALARQADRAAEVRTIERLAFAVRQDRRPYVPSWCYSNGPRECPCGHHEGFHDSAGRCCLAAECGCSGLPAHCLTPTAEL